MLTLSCIFSTPAYSSTSANSFLIERKKLNVKRTSQIPIIDGILDDEAWKGAAIATDFVQIDPYNGSPSSQISEIKLLYDDEAIYIGAMLYDTAPDSILNELSKRDQQGVSDKFGIHIDPFYDAKTTYGFFVTPAGVQLDSKVPATGRREDKNWDAVWESKTRIVDNGWIVEMRIPYSALRFPKKEIQLWGINFFREIKRFRERTSWNFINKEIAGTTTQAGEAKGISNIIPPLRLSAVPYLSGYIENNSDVVGWGRSYGYGVDVKYGINESFTLDVTLIPDFSQVQSDDRIVNLSPFETFYQERRPFFTEGTELFNRGDRIFYSRRIGNRPINRGDISDEYNNDQIMSNPETNQLINASKISGKTKSGLGVGIFNAMTSNTYAKVTENGEEKKVLTQPFTNYSMVVLDQALKNNSYISLYNTNVYRGKDEYMANVSGTDFRFVDKRNLYSLSGRFNLSQKYYPQNENEFGHSYNIRFEKISGLFRYNYSHSSMSDTYDHNDLGYLRVNNNFNHRLSFSYNEYRPFWKVMNMYNNISFSYNSLYLPREFSSFKITTFFMTTLRNYTSLNLRTEVQPIGAEDHYEPRVDGWIYKRPAKYHFNISISPDYRKKITADLRLEYTATNLKDKDIFKITITPRIRFNDQFTLKLTSQFKFDNKSYGYVDDSINTFNEEVIIFGERDVKTFTNTLESNYIFSNKSSLSFRLRYYWIRATYNDYFNLQRDGSLKKNGWIEDNDFNFTAFNIDMVYTWNFAPGSELLLVWKNAIYADNDASVNNFFDNLNYIFESPMMNSFSIKVLYYLDYQYLKKKSKR